MAPAPIAADQWQSLMTDTGQSPSAGQANRRFGSLRPTGSIGTEACIDCHEAQHESYLATSHSRSMRRISAGTTDEPPSEFEHTPTDRLYQVAVGDDKASMIHREFIRGKQHETIAINEAKVEFEIGSGDHAHSYLFEREGFLMQSPLTWYSSVERWGLSPGFDPSSQATFDRVVSANCVFCHVGSVRTQDNHLEQFAIAELTIGCERCHGAGGNHAAYHTEKAKQSGTEMKDDIVNPERLSRTLGEAICAQCHLQGVAAVSSDAGNRWDFRPGQPLGETVTDFQLRGVPAEFRIVGHTEQMHASGCYQNSETLTCTTCHDPHAHGSQQALKTRQQDRCATCHEEDGCGLPLEVRVSTQNNHCVTCHMPRRDTDVPHAALHDHRIAVHARSYQLASMDVPEQVATAEATDAQGPPRLVAVLEDAALPDWQKQRRWALAIHSLAFGDQLPPQMHHDFTRAQATLVELIRNGHSDPAIEIALSRDYLAANQFDAAKALAVRAAGRTKAGDPEHMAAADVLAQLALRAQDNQAALQYYRELTEYRLISGDHVMLAVCENNAGNRAAAIKALETALQVDPTLLFAHETMAAILDADGQTERAAAHRAAIIAIQAAAARLPSNTTK
ncbi:MAG: cytochrome c3 family protein [Planctomycetaceae bacterium]